MEEMMPSSHCSLPNSPRKPSMSRNGLRRAAVSKRAKMRSSSSVSKYVRLVSSRIDCELTGEDISASLADAVGACVVETKETRDLARQKVGARRGGPWEGS